MAEQVKRHRHIWVRWGAWEGWGWNPHWDNPTILFVCDRRGCTAVKVVPK